MIVDDEPFNLQGLKIIIQQSLKKLNFDKDFLSAQIDTATNGIEAMNHVEQRAASNQFYSLVFMDC